MTNLYGCLFILNAQKPNYLTILRIIHNNYINKYLKMESLIIQSPVISPGVVRVVVTATITETSSLGQRDGCGAEANFYLFPIIAFIALYLTITSKLYQFESIALHIMCKISTD